MDGRGRCMDNIFTERLWRTVKYENIYLYDYQNIEEARAGLTEYFQFYNHRRIHQSLDYKTPTQIYLSNNQLILKNQICLIEAKVLSWQTVHLIFYTQVDFLKNSFFFNKLLNFSSYFFFRFNFWTLFSFFLPWLPPQKIIVDLV